jgi:hypothetical protein
MCRRASDPDLEPKSDPEGGVANLLNCVIFFVSNLKPSQVHIFWRWIDWLKQAAQRPALFINLDETSVPFCFGKARGLVVKQHLWPSGKPPQQPLSRSAQRTNITHIALSTHRTDIQAKLPQIFVGNHHIFTKSLMEYASNVSSNTAMFWRMKSGWNTTDLMIYVLTALSVALQEFPEVQPILIMDCAKIHLAQAVLQHAAFLSIWLCLVPAKLTPMLQPLDVLTFAAYKAYLRKAFRRARATNRTYDSKQWLHLLCDVSRKFMSGRKWETSFVRTGILGSREFVSKELKPFVDSYTPPTVWTSPPYADVVQVLPSRYKISYWDLTRKPRGLTRRRLVVV